MIAMEQDVQEAKRGFREVAYHEAGHATMAWILGREVVRVSIFPDLIRKSDSPNSRQVGLTLGETWLKPLPPGIDLSTPKHRALAEREALVALAGNIAALKHRGQPRNMHLPFADLKGIGYAAAHMGGSQERLNAYLDGLASKAWLYLEVFWDQVQTVARCSAATPEASPDENYPSLLRR